MEPAAPTAIRSGWLVAAIALLTVIAFLPSLDNGFFNYDDDRYVLHNSLIRDFSASSLRKMFLAPSHRMYNPLVTLSFAGNYAWGQLDPWSYHLVNLAFHVLNSILVFFLLKALGFSPAVSFLCGLFFGIHPLHVESVAWISERKDVQSGFFLLGATLAYISYIRSSSRSGWFLFFLCLGLLLCSLLSKPIGIVFPLLALLIDRFLRRNASTSCVRLERTLWITISLIFLTLLNSHEELGEKAAEHGFSLFQCLLTGMDNLGWYLRKGLFPSRLSVFYPIPDPIHLSLSSALFLAFAGMVLILFRKKREVWFGAGILALFLVPYLKVIPFGAPFSRADRYFYLSSIGLFLVAFILWEQAFFQSKRRIGQILGLALIGVMVLLFAHQTFARCRLWMGSESLWQDAIEKFPNRSWLPYANLGEFYCRTGRFHAAIATLQKAENLDPGIFQTQNNLGLAFSGNQEFDKAIIHLEKAVAIDPKSEFALLNLGFARFRAGQVEASIRVFQKAIKENPSSGNAHYLLARLFFTQNQRELAAEHFASAEKFGYLPIADDLHAQLVNKLPQNY
jgi:hypothetical protein